MSFTLIRFIAILIFAKVSFAAPNPHLVKVPIGVDAELLARGVELNPDHFSHPSFRVGYVERGALEKLEPSLRARIEILDELRWALGGYDRMTFSKTHADLRSFAEGYHDYTALTQELNRLKNLYPQYVRLETAGKSVQGRELWYLILSTSPNEGNRKPKFLYHANMHGDEVVGRELMIYFARHLLEQTGKDARITQLMSHAEIFIMPSMNPDGFELRRRANANGKDLNRNFPDRFTSPSDTPGTREIEVKHMMALAAKHHFVYGINWHGGEICFNLPWGNVRNDKEENKYGDDHFFHPIGREYTEKNDPMHDNHHSNFDHGLTYGYEWYPVNGGINDWFNFFRRSVHAVIELSVTKWPSATTLAKFWDDNRDAMVTYLWRGLRGVHLEVRDTGGQLIPDVTVSIASSPKRPLKFDDGFVHRLTGDGKQEVSVVADGFKPKAFLADAVYFDGKLTEVVLER